MHMLNSFQVVSKYISKNKDEESLHPQLISECLFYKAVKPCFMKKITVDTEKRRKKDHPPTRWTLEKC